MDTHRPSHFDSTNFPYYSARMACYLEAVAEPPKVLGPPTDVVVPRTSNSYAGVHNDSTSSIICISIISPKSA
jgi:hypothetical protein